MFWAIFQMHQKVAAHVIDTGCPINKIGFLHVTSSPTIPEKELRHELVMENPVHPQLHRTMLFD